MGNEIVKWATHSVRKEKATPVCFLVHSQDLGWIYIAHAHERTLCRTANEIFVGTKICESY